MVKYLLQLHAINVFDDVEHFRHSGYDLITEHDDGSITIQSIDFSSQDWGDAIINITNGQAYEITDKNGNKIHWDSPLTSDEINTGSPEAKILLEGASALDAFNKIKSEAALTNAMDLDYNALMDTRVCNTATQYWAEKYINTIAGHEKDNVFDGLSGDFYGKDDDYVNASGYQQAQKLKFVGNIIDIMSNLGQIDDMLTNSAPYISDKYLSILKPYLESELAYNGEDVALENMLNDILAGTLSLSSLGGLQSSTKQLISGVTSQIATLFDTASITRSPLVIDLDGDGVETTGTSNGTHFDHDGNDFAERTGWAGKDDGLLVRDLNGDGEIENGEILTPAQANNDNDEFYTTFKCVGFAI